MGEAERPANIVNPVPGAPVRVKCGRSLSVGNCLVGGLPALEVNGWSRGKPVTIDGTCPGGPMKTYEDAEAVLDGLAYDGIIEPVFDPAGSAVLRKFFYGPFYGQRLEFCKAVKRLATILGYKTLSFRG